MTTPTPHAAEQPDALPDFSSLDPQRVIALVEDTLGRPATSMCRSLTSYINRVYEVRMADDSWVIAKFYRPHRWSLDALQDEHDFLCELRAAEVPVIAPLPAADAPADATLQLHDGLAYALFPKRGGRPLEEPLAGQWAELGRLLARVHRVGARHPPTDRITIGPRDSAAAHLDYLLRS
ncbi:MAG: phosphotransferase, partial [bacterium]